MLALLLALLLLPSIAWAGISGTVLPSSSGSFSPVTVNAVTNQTTVAGSPFSSGGSITIGTVQDIGAASTPTLGGLTLGAGSSLTGTLLFKNAANTNTVTLQAGTTSGNVTFKLPTADGANGACMITDGAGQLSLSLTCGGAAGGISSLGGQTGSTQTFANDTNVTMTSAANVHTLGWTGTLAESRGGFGASVAAQSGYPKNTAGVFAFSTTIPFTDLSGSLACAQHPALTGDVTTSACAATIAAGVVTNAKLATVATATFKARTTAGTGAPEDLTVTQATALLNVFTSALKGLAPSSGGGTTNFLRADGTWAAPGGAGTVTTSGSPASGNLAKFSGASSITNGDLSGDATTSGTLIVTVVNVNGVAYPATPSTQTVPVVTGVNTVTYQKVPNTALANSTVTVTGTANRVTVTGSPVSLGGTVTLSGPQDIATSSTPRFASLIVDSGAVAPVTITPRVNSVVTNTVIGVSSAANQFFTGVAAGDLSLRVASGKTLRLGTDDGAGTAVAGLSVSATGAVVQAAGDALTVFSGNAANFVDLVLGRTAVEVRLAVAAGAGQFFTDTAAGDVAVRLDASSKSIFFGVGTSGAYVMRLSSAGVQLATPLSRIYGGWGSDVSGPGATGVVSFNAGTPLFNNVLTAGNVLIGAAGNTVDSVGTTGSGLFVRQTNAVLINPAVGTGNLSICAGCVVRFGAGLATLGTSTLTLAGAASGFVSLSAAAAAGSTNYTLPAADGTNDQVLTTNGGGVLTWTGKAGGGGTGITTLNGQTGATQTFTSDTNVTMTSATNNHALGWSGTLARTRGGWGLDVSGSTGVVSFNAGVPVFGGAAWAWSDVLKRQTQTVTNTGPSWDNSRPFTLEATTSGARVRSTAAGTVHSNVVPGWLVHNVDSSTSVSTSYGDNNSITAFVHVEEQPAFSGVGLGFASYYEIGLSVTGNLHSSTTVDGISPNTTGMAAGNAIGGVGIPEGTTIALVTGANSLTLSAAATTTASGVALGVGSNSTSERAGIFGGTIVHGMGNGSPYGLNSFLGIPATVSSVNFPIGTLTELNCGIPSCSTKVHGVFTQNINTIGQTLAAASAYTALARTGTFGGFADDEAWIDAFRVTSSTDGGLAGARMRILNDGTIRSGNNDAGPGAYVVKIRGGFETDGPANGIGLQGYIKTANATADLAAVSGQLTLLNGAGAGGQNHAAAFDAVVFKQAGASSSAQIHGYDLVMSNAVVPTDATRHVGYGANLESLPGGGSAPGGTAFLARGAIQWSNGFLYQAPDGATNFKAASDGTVDARSGYKVNGVDGQDATVSCSGGVLVFSKGIMIFSSCL